MIEPHSKIDALARDIASAMPVLSALDRRMAVFLYKTLATATPVRISAIAAHCDVAASTVAERLARWPEVGRDRHQAVTSFWGLALEGMPHRIEVDGHALTTWCAWDAFFIPGIIERTADVRSTCPVTGEEVALRVSADAVSNVSPATAVVSIQRPARSFGADVVPNF